MLTEDQMWEAVQRKDPAFDGRFFLGVTSTGIFCFPSCPAKTPKRENIRFFVSREAARAAGFRPCKRCRTDLPGGRAEYETGIIEQARAVAGAQLESVTPASLARTVGLSPAYLGRLFRTHTGLTPDDFIRQRRAERAAELLRTGDAAILDVAAAVGFESTSSFYAAFRRFLGASPGEYRQQTEEQQDAIS
ncbi:MAG TPA: Ada metal-binding domain-containing protein [Symbiobacteriaceae bacterium]|nr:Ada metal-binding domain-containing protein [Symbiobacteriaceae bacterium]